MRSAFATSMQSYRLIGRRFRSVVPPEKLVLNSITDSQLLTQLLKEKLQTAKALLADDTTPTSPVLRISTDAPHAAPEHHPPAFRNEDVAARNPYQPPPPTATSSSNAVPSTSKSNSSQLSSKQAATEGSRPKKAETPPMRILVPDSLPNFGDFIARLDDGQTMDHNLLPSKTHHAISREVDTFTYGKNPIAGVDWWENLQEHRRPRGAKTICLYQFMNRKGLCTWTQDQPTQYACLTCTNRQRPCLLWDERGKKISVLPLPEEARSGATSREDGFWVCFRQIIFFHLQF